MKLPDRMIRVGLAAATMILVDLANVKEAWEIGCVVVATYLIFTAYTGECLVREYLLARRKHRSRSKHNYR